MIDLNKIASDLLIAHATKKTIDEKPVLQNTEQAYTIQKIIAEKLGPRIGWKIGNPSKNNFVKAPMYKSTTFIGETQIKRNQFNRCLVESELAIVFKNAMPKKKSLYTLEEVNANIASINVGIEIIDSRLQHWPDIDPLWQLADGLVHGGYVLGSGLTTLQNKVSLDKLNHASFKITVGEKHQPPRVTIKETREHPFKDPGGLTLWLVNHLIADNDQINAGDIITTGSFSGSTPINANEIACVEFQNIGQATLTLE